MLLNDLIFLYFLSLQWLVLVIVRVGTVVEVDGGFVGIHSVFEDKSSFDGVVLIV
jgi:hypothetical protein